MKISIHASQIGKKFNSAYIFKNISFTVSTSRSVAITGPNGSGKSTLLEIIAGIRKPDKGRLIYEKDSGNIDIKDAQEISGFSSFRINPYRELTAFENIGFVYKSSGEKNAGDYFDSLLSKFNLYNSRDKKIKYFSSGMLQRLRFICAIINDPHILLLDEPGSNLDKEGRDIIYSYIESVKKEKIIIIATNEQEEVDICLDSISLPE
jgi:ABC-type multidrug transport system ATPase subunit